MIISLFDSIGIVPLPSGFAVGGVGIRGLPPTPEITGMKWQSFDVAELFHVPGGKSIWNPAGDVDPSKPIIVIPWPPR
jgi:hypothetical protein